jgi:hypothetical protein
MKAENITTQKGRRGSRLELLLSCVIGEYDIYHVQLMTAISTKESITRAILLISNKRKGIKL